MKSLIDYKSTEERIKKLESNPTFDYLLHKKVLTLEEASKLLGYSISYLYKLISNKEIPHYKPNGKMVYFDNCELREWMKTRKYYPHKKENQVLNNQIEENMTPKIQKTSDYELFSFIDENRNIRDGKVKNLMKSIQNIDLTKYQPILVSCDMNVIDGQHRFEACKRLGLPIYYIVLDKDVDIRSSMIILNQVLSQWRMTDFLNYHAEMQGGRWAEMKEWDDKYKLGLSNTAVIFAKNQMNATQIREGVVDFEKNTSADKIAEFLQSEEVLRLKFHNTRPFVVAIRHAFEKYTDKQIQKLKKNLVFIEHKANFEQYLIAFDNLVGYKAKRS